LVALGAAGYTNVTGIDLRRITEEAGLQVERISYWNFLLTFPAIILAAVTRLLPTPSSDDHGHLLRLPGMLNRLLFRLLWLENQILHRANFVLGTSVFVIATK
jgi:hypothetical protein